MLAVGLGAQTLRQTASIDLPGPKGQRFDYLTIDDEDHYLLSAHLRPEILYVIDVRTNKLIKAIPGVPGITGLEFVPELRKVYTSDWGEENIGVVDLRTMSVTKRLTTARKPNGSTYAAPFHKVYVADTLEKAVAVVDVQKDEIVKTLRFESETGMPQYDSVARKVYVNLRNSNEVTEIDPPSAERDSAPDAKRHSELRRVPCARRIRECPARHCGRRGHKFQWQPASTRQPRTQASGCQCAKRSQGVIHFHRVGIELAGTGSLVQRAECVTEVFQHIVHDAPVHRAKKKATEIET